MCERNEKSCVKKRHLPNGEVPVSVACSLLWPFSRPNLDHQKNAKICPTDPLRFPEVHFPPVPDSGHEPLHVKSSLFIGIRVLPNNSRSIDKCPCQEFYRLTEDYGLV
jgi:hypothetical protein